ncbi:TonB-dependent receptor domain-containing protein [Luteimonas sp. SDU101]|uniref:TonB-dependent receptor domain-containing protein n=1 Tax=Luteimonas sp. SDU101 TaxID=3422593 RepID=UPI003EB800F2
MSLSIGGLQTRPHDINRLSGGEPMRQARFCSSTELHRGIVRALRGGLLAAGLCLPLGVAAQAPSAAAPVEFDIPAQPLPAALKAYADQTGTQLLYRAEAVGHATARPVQGAMDRREALQRLLQGTGLEVVYSGADAATIRPESSARRVDAREQDGGQAASAVSPGPVDDDDKGIEAGTGSGASTLEAVTVTGTRIRGGTSASPTITIGSERIREEGFNDLGEVIRSVPQNFGGGQNPGAGSGGFSGAGFANQNVTGGSALNLRGLGPDATLTLLNGRRMAYSGFAQAVDISAIPVDAVERIEIVADGASAIYGSDAVGGVGNVILRRDYDGATLGARFGAASDGGLGTREYTATAGTYWASGGVIAAFKDASVDPIYAADRAYARHLGPPTTLYPGSDLRSGLLSAYQSLGDTVELRLDALRSRRHQQTFYEYMGINRLTPVTTTSLLSPGAEFRLPRDWTLALSGAWARDEHHERQVREAPATGVTTSVVNDCFCNESRSYEASVEGPLLTLSAGEMRLAAGVGYRSNTFRQSALGTGIVATQGEESARFGYAEVRVPVVGAGQDMPGVQRFEVTAAVRSEDYSNFGGVTTPKLGLIYSPNADFTAKASWGRSFKAPTLLQVNQGQFAQLGFARDYGGTPDAGRDMALRVGGGNRDLQPERARTLSASLAYHPEALSGLQLELTAFRIDYADRVVQPITDYAQVLANPAFAQVIDRQPALEELTRIANLPRFFNFTGQSFDPDRVGAVIYGNYVNVARQEITGADLTGSYRLALGEDTLTLRGTAAWLDSTQQNTGAQDFVDLSGTLFNPPELSGRAGVVWERGAFTASTFASYRGGVTNTTDGRKTASFTTFDAALRYRDARSEGAWSGVEVSLSAQNLLDRAPPLYTPASFADYAPPYDGTNYSAIGRFVSISLSKHF